jgi:hypothetical protein
MAKEPSSVKVRMYNVGFGDCFLLSFYYKKPLADQHILIDFGTVGGKANMKAVANDIKKECGGKLYAVVATHRHRDHIGGFSDAGGPASTGALIASLKPEIVVQPWTENPSADAMANSAPLLAKKRRAGDKRIFMASLAAMTSFAETTFNQVHNLRGEKGRAGTLEKLALNNVKNLDAVNNLRTMGKRPPRFLQYNSASGLENSKLLPGVKVRVLGPPALKDQNIKKYAKDSEEYWISSKYWGLQDRASKSSAGRNLFPRQPRFQSSRKPIHTRWFTNRADGSLKRNALSIVTVLDDFLNNTSLILLFEVRGKKLLFPGDAQLENWSYALEQKGIKKLLQGVDLYKVGHHGSRNATPKQLWELFDKRKHGLTTMMSTSPGVYHKSEEGKVPAARLVRALGSQSKLKDTQKLKGARGPLEFEF